ncbi:hypothetical protein F4553_005350 [Allocatelliglobosispora scoriae]|uniref:Uncharacterized protein n=1 Tax=Allocatelliglobosispora scoriae TaxID=643052 RepID=A0A841BZ78_9ACTN|nr:hypothetical protein [Allocatelliglobosispora scoriae]
MNMAPAHRKGIGKHLLSCFPRPDNQLAHGRSVHRQV